MKGQKYLVILRYFVRGNMANAIKRIMPYKIHIYLYIYIFLL